MVGLISSKVHDLDELDNLIKQMLKLILVIHRQDLLKDLVFEDVGVVFFYFFAESYQRGGQLFEDLSYLGLGIS